MSWFELQIHRLPRSSFEQLSATLFDCGAQGVQEDQPAGEQVLPNQLWESGPNRAQPPTILLRAWFENPSISSLTKLLPTGLKIHWEPMPETDWEQTSKDSFPPLVINDKFTICPPWNTVPGALIIEPGQGYGTGHHATTQGALRLLSELPSLSTAHDIGCGSGILAIAATSLGMSVKGIDIDKNAIEEAQANAKLNTMAIQFSTTPITQLHTPADVVLANLFAEKIVELQDKLLELATTHWILAGIMEEKEHLVLSLFAQHATLQKRDVQEGWVALHFKRNSCI